METRDDIDQKIHNDQGNIDDSVKAINESVINIEDDGIKRVDEDDKRLHGYLVISPQGSNNDRHLALKVDDQNIYWTISPSQDGSQLEIGILDNEGHKTVISFSNNEALRFRNQAVRLDQPLELMQGLTHTHTEETRGIQVSGFRGFKSGRVPSDGFWHDTKVPIPRDTFGKYRVQAWLIQKDEKDRVIRSGHTESIILYFPDEAPKKLTTIVYYNMNKLQRVFYDTRIWLRKTFKKLNINIDIKEKSEELERHGAKLSIDTKPREDQDADKKQHYINIKCNSQISDREDVNPIYYTVERLWEGEHWIDDRR